MTRKLTLYSILWAALYGKAREETHTAIIKVEIQNLAQEFFTFRHSFHLDFAH
jgi:hypothetical protein